MVAKLSAANQRFHGRPDTVIVRGELVAHFVNERFIGQLYGSSQGKANQFLAELTHKIITSLGQQVAAEPVKAREFRSIWQPNMGIDRFANQVFFTQSSYRVKRFQGKTKRIDSQMAIGTAWITNVSLGAFSDGQAVAIHGVR